MEPPQLTPLKILKKKRVLMEPDVIEIPPSSLVSRTKIDRQRKHKQVALHEVIDIDKYEDSDDVIILDEIVDTKNKGKAVNDNSDGYDEAKDAFPNHSFNPPTSLLHDLSSALLYVDDEEYSGPFFDDLMDFDEYASLQAHFDNVDFPPGIEAPVTWLPDFVTSTKKANGGDSFYISNQVHFNSVGSQSSKPVHDDRVPSSAANYSTGYASKLDLSSFCSSVQTDQSKKKVIASQHAWNARVPHGVAALHKGYPIPTPNPNNQNGSTNILYPNSATVDAMKYPTATGLSMPLYTSKTQPYKPFPNTTSHSNFSNPFHAIHDPPEEGTLRAPKNIDEDGIVRAFQYFKHFDTVEEHSDHHYKSKSKSMKQPPKDWAKRIQEEWRILEKDLPDTIFVRVYETRMDLLRAVIIGAGGTPYHDGLFFFDVVIPSGYPNVPPLVHYHSHGLRLNPNLYACGKVCLSLLGTWTGNNNENWIPGVSTLLQVLVSIQALILNQKPFFNEPGYERMNGSAEGEKKSQQYNENTFFLSVRTMVYTMRKPPKHFEDFVIGHFHKRAHDILVACKAYMDGAQVGCLVKGGVQDVDEGDKSCSTNFKNSLPEYIDMLAKAFSQIGFKDAEKFQTSAKAGNKKVGNVPRCAI